MVKAILFYLFLLIPLSFQEYPKNLLGSPSTEGIKRYVEENDDKVVKEFQLFVNDTIFNYDITTDKLSDYSNWDTMELGRFYPPYEVILTNEEEYVAYELIKLPKFQRRIMEFGNRFVKGVMVHEIGHIYFNQILEIRVNEDKLVFQEFKNFSIFPRPDESFFGSIFIEEGVCEWLSFKMGQIVEPRAPYIPKTRRDLTDQSKSFLVKYQYSLFFVDRILKEHGVKDGINIILSNKPPNYEEILTPEKYYSRIKLDLK